MFDPEKQAMIYFAARHPGPWHWTDDGDVLAWSDGTTIAFRQEVIFILDWLIPHRWPPFDALVHLLAAFRGKIAPGTIQQTSGEWPATKAGDVLDEGKQMMLGAFHQRQKQMHAVVDNGLIAISNLPADLRASAKAKATVAEMIFSRPAADAASAREIQRMTESDSEQLPAILEVLRSGVLTDAILNTPVVPTRYNDWSWQILHHGFAGLDLGTLELRIRTGLDAVPQPAPLPIPPATRVRQVLEELRRDAEHAGFARLVRDFMAAIQLPRRLSEQDEMPIGGFADITNRGNPDRLLLSELAHDDLTLAVRMAMNEALYLRREPPAKQPPSTLAVLLDSGVRLWGVPRVLATAVAMALVAKSPPQDECAIFRACGPLLQPVDLLSKQGVITHLEALEPHAHPGAALAAFRARLGEEEHAEAVLITHVDVLGDPDFHRALASAAFEALYLAVVERDGSFRLHRYPHGSSPLCEAEVDIEALFPKPPNREKKRAPLIDHSANPDLPLILSRRPFPLLVPVHGSVQKAIPLRDGGGACVMRDRRLLVWRKGQRGARTVATGLPRGVTLWLGELENGSLCVVKTCNRRQRLACRVYSRDGDLLHDHDWTSSESVRRVECRDDVMFIIHSNQAEVRDMTTGEILASQVVSGLSSHGRYFLYQTVWCVLVWEGQSLRLEPVILLGGLQIKDVLRVFNNDDSEGPWVLTRAGDLHNASGQRVMRLGEPKPVVRIAEDGRRLMVTSAADNKTRVVDVATRKQREVRGYLRDEDWLWQATLPVWNVRSRATRIGFTSEGHICLMTTKGRWCYIDFVLSEFCLKWNPPVEPADVQDFALMHLPDQPGFTLKVASWPDGRRAWLDSRGMLHLRCAKQSPPEVTISLSEHHMAAWATNGMYCQYGAFWSAIVADEDEPRTSPRAMWVLVEQFIKPA
jgi:hypothetical protein